MNNLYLTKPKDGSETQEDEDFLLRAVLDYQGKGNRVRFSICQNPMPELKPHPRGWKYLCDFHHIEGHVFASEGGDTRREALEATIAVVVASQLEGAKVTSEPLRPGIFDDLPSDSYF